MSSRSRFIVFIVLLLLTFCIVLKECIAYESVNHGFFQYESKNTPLRQEKSYDNLLPNISSSESWSPFKVNESCPIFAVESDHSHGGFGDQFERYAHLLNIAQLLKATAVTTFTQVGSHEYIKLARLMNINVDLQNEYTKYNISHHISFRSLDEIKKIHTEILSNNGASPRLPCHSAVRVNMYDCGGTWCSFLMKEIHEVKWILRNNSFASYCAKNKVGFKRERGRVNVLWHVRSGDLCIRCKDTGFFDSLVHLIRTAVQSKAQTLLHFESASNLSEIMEHYGSHASFFINRPIIESVCRMITTDILVTSGSSLAYVAAISNTQLPLIMEEMRKEAQPQFHATFGGGDSISESLRHVFNEDEAVLLINGRPTIPEWKFNHRLIATLTDILNEESR
eukprot:gene23414-31758_t